MMMIEKKCAKKLKPTHTHQAFHYKKKKKEMKLTQ